MTVATTPFQTTILPTAARGAGVDLKDVTEKIGWRVSVNSIKETRSQLAAGREIYGDHPSLGPWLEKLYAAFDDPATTEAEREKLGFHIVRESDLLVGHLSDRRVGWVAAVPAGEDARGAAIVLVTTNSSIERALTRKDGATENAYALLVTQAWRGCPGAYIARHIRWDRLHRHKQVAADIWAAYESRLGCRVHIGKKVFDPKEDGWEIAIQAEVTAKDAKATKEKTIGGTVSLLRTGAWPLSERHLPAGLRHARVTTPAGQELVDRTQPPEHDAASAAHAEFALKMLARGVSATAVGYELGVRGRLDGDGKLALLQMLPGIAALSDRKASAKLLQRVREELIPVLNDAQAQALTSALEDIDTSKGACDAARGAAIQATRRIAQHIEFYKTGRFQWIHAGSVENHTDYNGRSPKFPRADDARVPENVADIVVRDSELAADPTAAAWFDKTPEWQQNARKKGIWWGESEWASPVRLTDEEWAALDHVMSEHPSWGTKRSPQHHRIGTRKAAPLSQLGWHDGETDHNSEAVPRAYSVTLDHSAYQLWTGPSPDAVGENWSHIRQPWLRVAANDLHEALGNRLIELAQRMESAAGPLPLLVGGRRTDAQPVSPVEQARARVARLEDAIAAENKVAVGLVRDSANEEEGSHGYEITQAAINESKEKLDQLNDDLALAREDVAEAQQAEQEQQPAQRDQDDDGLLTEVDAHPLIAVGVALQRLAGRDEHTAPPQLAKAVHWLLRGGSGLRVTAGEGRLVEFNLTVRVPDADGLPLELDAGTLRLTRSDKHDRGRPSEGIATLYDEAPLRVLWEQNAETFLDRTGWSHQFLVEQLRDWLQEHDIGFGECTALIDAALAPAALPTPAIVYAHLTARTGTGHQAARQAARTFGADPAFADDVLHAYASDGTWPQRGTGWVRSSRIDEHRDLVALLVAQPGGRGRRGPVAEQLGISRTDLSHLVNGASGFDLCGVQPYKTSHRTIGLPSCATEDCVRQGEPLNRVVAVPESLCAPTPAALVCSGCRTPDGWEHPLPAVVVDELWTATDTYVNVAAGCAVHTAAAPRSSWPILSQPLSQSAAARRLNLSYDATGKLIDSGVLPAAATHNNRGGYTIQPDDLDIPEVRHEATRLRRRKRVQQLTCEGCDVRWSRPPKPGRPPTRCPTCRVETAA